MTILVRLEINLTEIGFSTRQWRAQISPRCRATAFITDWFLVLHGFSSGFALIICMLKSLIIRFRPYSQSDSLLCPMH